LIAVVTTKSSQESDNRLRVRRKRPEAPPTVAIESDETCAILILQSISPALPGSASIWQKLRQTSSRQES
jgi:hypothetical protein